MASVFDADLKSDLVNAVKAVISGGVNNAGGKFTNTPAVAGDGTALSCVLTFTVTAGAVVLVVT